MITKKKKNFNNNSVNRTHFKNHKNLSNLEKKKIFIPKNNLGEIRNLRAPYPKKSIYKENFLDWGNSLPNIFFKPKNIKSKKKLPFIAKSSNKAYGNYSLSDLKNINFKQKFGKQEFKNPIGPNLKFKIISTQKQDFKNIFSEKTKGGPKDFLKGGVKEKMDFAFPSYKGKFDTSTGCYGKYKPVLCPAKVLLRKEEYEDFLKKNEEFDFSEDI